MAIPKLNPRQVGGLASRALAVDGFGGRCTRPGEGRGCQHDDGRPVLRGGTVPQAAGDAVILPVAQDDDGAVPRAELPESVQQREAQLRCVGHRSS